MRKIFLLASLVVMLVFAALSGIALAREDIELEPVAPLQEEEPMDPLANLEIPYVDQWVNSAHAAIDTDAFRHWDEDDPAEIPTSCAKCHSTSGYQDYLGADGTEDGVVDAAVPVGEVVACVACHNDATSQKTSVVMPSGLELTGLGDESRCMECHQGRESKVSVDKRIADAAVENDDTISEGLSFRNIHYFAAGATRFGADINGVFEYPDKEYAGFFEHVDEASICSDCHGAHSLQLDTALCVECHEEIEDSEDIRDIRYTFADYNGNGDDEEGVYYEIASMKEALYEAIVSYASETVGTGIFYDSHSYPYFFTDTNGNGIGDPEEVDRSNGYSTWTPRLLQAAYNYQYVSKDPGAFAHNAPYILQVLYDSLEDLGADVSDMERP